MSDEPATSDDSTVTLARAATPRGEIALRRRREGRRVVHELIVAGVFAMDTVDVSTEVALAHHAIEHLAQAGTRHSARVLVGGLGLGYTAAALLADPRIERVVVAEIEAPLLAWARAGLTSQLGAIAASPRVELREQDIATALRQDERYAAILLDVDNGPSFLVHPHNASLYAESTLAQAISRLEPNGVLVIWAAQPEPALLLRLQRVLATRPGWTARERLLSIERSGRTLDYAIYRVSPA